MQNTETYSLKVEKKFNKPVADVFRALAEGRLFQNCGADTKSMKIDFKVGGKYEIIFKNYGVSNFGEFKEIVPNEKIAFTWCQTFEEPRTPDTLVTIVLAGEGASTNLTLTHSGFTTEDSRNDHQGGWTAGLDDLTSEMVLGKVRFVRVFDVPVQKLYETIGQPQSFLGQIGKVEKDYAFRVGSPFKIHSERSDISGPFTGIEPNKKIAFTWISTCETQKGLKTHVTLSFDEEDDGGSSVELIHEGLSNDPALQSTKEGWEFVLGALKETLASASAK